MEINTTGKVLNTAGIYFYEGEENPAAVGIRLPAEIDGVPLADLTYQLAGVSTKDTRVEQTLVKEIVDGAPVLKWKIEGLWTAVTGTIQLELRGQNTDGNVVIKWQSTQAIPIKPTLPAGSVPTPDIIQQYLDSMRNMLGQAQTAVQTATNAAGQAQAAAAKAEAASAAMPYVGEDGYWYTWDNTTGKFVKTNVPKDHSHEMSEVRGLSTTMATKANISLGEAGEDLLAWASMQIISGGFAVSPNGSPINNPAPGRWLWGELIKPVPNRTIVKLTDGPFGVEYKNYVDSDAWQGWTTYATATPPQEFDLPLAEGTTPFWMAKYTVSQDSKINAFGTVRSESPLVATMVLFTLPVGTRPSGVLDVPIVYHPSQSSGYGTINNNGQFLAREGMGSNDDSVIFNLSWTAYK